MSVVATQVQKMEQKIESFNMTLDLVRSVAHTLPRSGAWQIAVDPAISAFAIICYEADQWPHV